MLKVGPTPGTQLGADRKGALAPAEFAPGSRSRDSPCMIRGTDFASRGMPKRIGTGSFAAFVGVPTRSRNRAPLTA